jgi:hypothetical protein
MCSFSCAHLVICWSPQDLGGLSISGVDSLNMHLLLGGMDKARHTLHTLEVTFRRDYDKVVRPGLPLTLKPFTALTYVLFGAREEPGLAACLGAPWLLIAILAICYRSECR